MMLFSLLLGLFEAGSVKLSRPLIGPEETYWCSITGVAFKDPSEWRKQSMEAAAGSSFSF